MSDLKKLEKETILFPDRAKRIIVHDGKTLTIANDFLLSIKLLMKEVANTFNPIIQKAHAAHKEAVAQKKRYEEPLTDAERTIKIHIGSYLEDEAKKEREAEEKARKIEEERQQKETEALERAKKYQDQGMEEEAEEIINEIPLPARVPEPPPSKPEGLIISQIVDTEKINRFVETTKGQAQIPGIRIYPVWKWEIEDRKLIPSSYYRSSMATRDTKEE